MITRFSISQFILHILVINSWTFAQSLYNILHNLPSVFYFKAQFCNVYKLLRWFQRSSRMYLLKMLRERNLFCIISVYIFLIFVIVLQALFLTSRIFFCCKFIFYIQFLSLFSFAAKAGRAIDIFFICS